MEFSLSKSNLFRVIICEMSLSNNAFIEVSLNKKFKIMRRLEPVALFGKKIHSKRRS
jgi:hypothetical protein